MGRTVHSICPLDCPDACTLAVTVEGDRVVRVDGSDLNPVTAGYVCGKVAHAARHLYCDDRLGTPLIRTGPKGAADFREATWDEALDLVAERMAQTRDRLGGEAILPCSYGGSNGFLTEGSHDRRLFSRLGASQLLRDLCALTAGRALQGLYGKMPGVAFTDFPRARLVVVWGCNPNATGVHLVPQIQAARRAGAKLVVVDPRRTPLARRADLHLAVRPGADGPVALAVIRWLFEHGHADEAFLEAHCDGADELRERAAAWPLERAAEVAGLAVADLEAFARMYAATSPALIRCGWGLERNRNGGSGVAAVLALPAVAGKFGVRGGGYTASNSGAWAFDPEAAAGAERQTTRTVRLGLLGPALDALSDPPIGLLYVYNGNPLATCPDQRAARRGLKRDDLFVVVHDAVMTDTARYADVVLPATTFLEHDELARGYGSYVLNRSRPAAPPFGSAKPNGEVFDSLLDRLGLGRPADPRTPDAMADAVVRAHHEGGRLARELSEDRVALPPTGAAPVQMVDVFPRTPSGRIELAPPALDAESASFLYAFHPVEDEHPLTLITPADRRAITSTFFQLVEAPALRIHPDDAGPRGIATGDEVRLHNALGETFATADVSDGVRPGVVCIPKGLWAKHTRTGETTNALIAAEVTDLGGSPTFNDTRVEVTRVQER